APRHGPGSGGHDPYPHGAAQVLQRRCGSLRVRSHRARRARGAPPGPPLVVPEHLRRDGVGAAAPERFREFVSRARARRAGHRAGGRRRRDHSRCSLRRLTVPERVLLTIGTKKGLFVAEAPKSRGKFALRGPFGSGVAVYATLTDTRGNKPRIYASSCNAFFGMKVLSSTDLGKTFHETKSAPAFPKDDGRALANIWSLEPGDGEGDLWCGVEPASLFRSQDGGDSWEMVPGISNHEHARKWQPGNGGLCLHTILRDGNRMHLGISTGGHYLSEDGG